MKAKMRASRYYDSSDQDSDHMRVGDVERCPTSGIQELRNRIATQR